MATLAAPTKPKHRRANTVKLINQYMQDAELDQYGELDLVTFIVAAQAIKPGAQEEDLMKIFDDYDASETKDGKLSDRMHSMLTNISVEESGPVDLSCFGENSVDLSDTEGEVSVGLRTRSMTDREAEREAQSVLAKTEQKMEIAKSMLAQGYEPTVVRNVVGLEEDAFSNIDLADLLSAPDEEEKEPQMMTTEEITEVLRLLNSGPDQIAKEAELAHKLMTRLKDSLLNFSASQPLVSSTDTPDVSISEHEGRPASPRFAPKLWKIEVVKKKEPYEVVFDRKPLGMSWNQTSDGKNLYVQDVVPSGLATTLGVQVGSLIHSFNQNVVHNTGPDSIYQEFKSCSLPITIGFLPPAASGSNDEKVLILKQVTGLETKTVIKLLHKFNGNVQAANEAFYIAKARTKQYLSKQQEKKKKDSRTEKDSPGSKKSTKKGFKKDKGWWSNWKKKSLN